MNSLDTGTQSNGSAQDNGLTLSERLELALAFQKQALTRPDLLAANMDMIKGDLIRFAHALADQIQKQLIQGGIPEERRRRLLLEMEMHLKVVREFERLAQLDRRYGPASRDKSEAQ
jgi:hypothetical protein